MVIVNYLDILSNFEKILKTWEYNYSKAFIEVEKSLTPLNNQIAGIIMKRDLRTGVIYQDLKYLIETASFLNVQIFIESKLNNLFDSFTFERGSNTFKEVFYELISSIKRYETQLNEKISRISDYETKRLNEALHCLFEHCFFSAVVNSVVALEYRLLNLLKKANEPFLLTKSSDLRFTLGQLISHYLNNKTQFNNIIPQKFDQLLKLCNSFRIFSAHAKDEEMNNNDARAIVSLTFSFLLDDRCKA